MHAECKTHLGIEITPEFDQMCYVGCFRVMYNINTPALHCKRCISGVDTRWRECTGVWHNAPCIDQVQSRVCWVNLKASLYMTFNSIVSSFLSVVSRTATTSSLLCLKTAQVTPDTSDTHTKASDQGVVRTWQQSDYTHVDWKEILGAGDVMEIPKAVCLHEEDAGVLWKHMDYRTGELLSHAQRF